MSAWEGTGEGRVPKRKNAMSFPRRLGGRVKATSLEEDGGRKRVCSAAGEEVCAGMRSE